MMTRQPDPFYLKHTAYHEAGHAVIGRRLGMICGPATIHADDDSAGHSITADPWAIQAVWKEREKYREFESVVRGRIITFMAGHETECEILGNDAGGDGTDRYWIGRMMGELVHPENDEAWERIEHRLRQATRALVRRHRAAIDRVAEALLARGSLSAHEIDALVGLVNSDK